MVCSHAALRTAHSADRATHAVILHSSTCGELIAPHAFEQLRIVLLNHGSLTLHENTSRLSTRDVIHVSKHRGCNVLRRLRNSLRLSRRRLGDVAHR